MHATPRRVLIVTHFFADHGGGIERVAAELAKQFVLSTGTAPNDSIKWMATYENEPPTLIPGVTLQCASGWNGIERRFGIPFPIWSLRSMRELHTSMLAASAIHVHDFFYPANLYAIVMGPLLGKKVVLTQHIGEIPYKNPFLRTLLSLVNRTLGRLAMQSASQVVFISQSVQSYFMRFARFKTAPVFIPNGLDTNLFQPRERRGIPARPSILFVGRFVEKKGLHVLESIVRATPEYDWVMIGTGPIDPRKWSCENLKVIATISQQELVAHYQAATLFVLPSWGEGFPLVVQEAMACGLPCVIARESARAHPHIESLVFAPDEDTPTAEQWLQLVLHALSHEHALAEKRIKALAFAHAAWSWRGSFDKYSTFYETEAR
jgi:glycosyltransferase involved in cell wall biosynthesis